MPTGGPAYAGPQSWGFIPTGPTLPVALAASTVTVTLNQFVTTAPYAPSCHIWSIGAAAINSVVFAAFGNNNITVSPTVGVPIVPVGLMAQSGGSGGPTDANQIFLTGKRPNQYVVLGSAGTVTCWVTPGEGHR